MMLYKWERVMLDKWNGIEERFIYREGEMYLLHSERVSTGIFRHKVSSHWLLSFWRKFPPTSVDINSVFQIRGRIFCQYVFFFNLFFSDECTGRIVTLWQFFPPINDFKICLKIKVFCSETVLLQWQLMRMWCAFWTIFGWMMFPPKCSFFGGGYY
jgi:hypothetical protein